MRNDLVQDAIHYLSGRQRGSEDRKTRLEAAGIATDWGSLRKWLASEQRRRKSAAGYWLRGTSVRAEHGGDPDLAVVGRYAPRVEADKPVPQRDKDGKWYCTFEQTGVFISEYGTEEEAIRAGDDYLRRWGWTKDCEAAIAGAVADATSRASEPNIRQSILAAKGSMTTYAMVKAAQAYCPKLTETAVAEYLDGRRDMMGERVEALMKVLGLTITK